MGTELPPWHVLLPHRQEDVRSPGAVLRELAEAVETPLGWVAALLGMSAEEMDLFVAGETVMTRELAERLARVSGVPSEGWGTLELIYRLGPLFPGLYVETGD